MSLESTCSPQAVQTPLAGEMTVQAEWDADFHKNESYSGELLVLGFATQVTNQRHHFQRQFLSAADA